MIRDMMIECVERRFQAPRTPYRVQWLTDNGSIYAAAKTVDIALALGLDPCFTPVESPESNGMAEAFGKTFKRDYVRVNPIPNAASTLAAIEEWMDDYNEVHPHSGSATAHPRVSQSQCPTGRVSGLTGSIPQGVRSIRRCAKILAL
jgi:putative transposase